MRKNRFNPMQTRLVCAGYKVNDQNIREMLQFMGIRPTDEVVKEAIGFISAHSMEMNMTNLHSFITEKGYNVNRIDLREKKN